MTDEACTRLVLGSAAARVRRAVGSTAWVVLEELAARATVVDAQLTVSASVRSLAGALGIAKDTAARAVNRLRVAGLADVSQTRTPSGVFETTTYQLHIPADVVTIDADASNHTSNDTSRAMRRASRRSRGESAQLALAIES